VHYARSDVERPVWSAGTVKDLSLVGVCFRTEERLEPGTALHMKFNLPVPALQLVRGAVVRRWNVGSKQYEYGVEFEPLRPEAAAILDAYLKRICERAS